MAPPQQTEKVILENPEERLNLKELAQKGHYMEYPKELEPELTPFEHKDVGHLADPKKASLYDHAEKIFDITPNIGTEIHGLQLSKLTDQQKNDLALLVAERGVVFFRGQDIDPYQGREFGSYFGPLHIHTVVGHPPGLNEVLPIYYGPDIPNIFAQGALQGFSSDGWHSDVSYELQPPAFTFLKIDTLPGEVGGDTIWASGYAAYDRLSPELKKQLEGLEAVHSGKEQVQAALDAGHGTRRKNVEHIHPIVRTHPVTGLKTLFVQPGFTRRIVGFGKHESDALLKLLYSHIAGGYDFHVRFKWTEDAVAVWDNRVTNHVGVFDYANFGRRHGWRITTQGERPYFDPKSKSQREVREEKLKQAEQKN